MGQHFALYGHSTSWCPSSFPTQHSYTCEQRASSRAWLGTGAVSEQESRGRGKGAPPLPASRLQPAVRAAQRSVSTCSQGAQGQRRAAWARTGTPVTRAGPRPCGGARGSDEQAVMHRCRPADRSACCGSTGNVLICRESTLKYLGVFMVREAENLFL